MTKRNKIQELVYRFLGKGKTTPLDDLIARIEEILDDDAERSPKTKYAVTRTLKTLTERGEVEHLDASHSSFVRLTDEGRQRMRTLDLDRDTLPVPTAWDGKWRIVILNIPESKKEQRNALRYLLKKAQFVCVKNSVWISPYPFEHFFENIKRDMNLNDEIMIVVSDEIDNTTLEYFKDCYTE